MGFELPDRSISSPVLHSAVISPLVSGVGDVAGGTTANLHAG
jgi:hypothetical protein